MHLNIIPEKKTNRRFMVFVETYVGDDRKQHSRTVERIGYVDEFEGKYADPVAHFREEAKRRNKEKSDGAGGNVVALELQKDGVMKFDAEGRCDTMMHYGDAFIAWVIHRLGLDRFVDSRRKYLGCDYNLTNLMRLFIYERILEPSSKLRNWRNRGRYYERMEFTQAQVYSGLQQLGRYKEAMLEHLNGRMKVLYGRTQGYGYFDGTNVYYEIEDEDGFREKGVSKEHRPLPITQLGVMLDSNGFPMSYDIWAGNTNDSVMLPPAVSRVRERFGMKHMVYVADKGFYSGDTIADIIIRHDAYVIANSVRGTKIDEAVRKKVLDRSGYTFVGPKGQVQEAFGPDTDFMYKTIDVAGYRNVTGEDGKKKRVQTNKYMISFWSRKYDERAKIDRMETVEKAIEKSHTNSKSKIDNTYGANRFLKTEVKDKDGKTVEDYEATVKYNQKALDDVEELDGYYLIETNLAGVGWFGDDKPFDDGQTCRWREDWGMLQLNRELTPLDIIEIYRGLWRIEDSFRAMKSFLKMRPVYVWNRESLEGHFLICFLSLLVMRILECEAGGKYTTRQVTESLRRAMLAEIAPGKYFTTYYDMVLMELSMKMNLGANQKLYTQKDLQKLFARTRKDS